jgi:glycosyltransferase involved in cell wall biosynthesis
MGSSYLEHSTSKKVVWLCSLFFSLDMVVTQKQMTKHLSELFSSVKLIAPLSKTDYQEMDKENLILLPLKYVPLISHFLYTLALAMFFPFYVAIEKPTYLIVDKGTAVIALILKVLMPWSKSKVILDIRTTPLKGEGKFYDKWDPFLFALSISLAKKKFDGVTFVSELMKNEICSRFNIDSKWVRVWTSGVSTEVFNPEDFNGKEIRKKFDLDSKFVIFYHGSLGLDRGIVESIMAMGRIKKRYRDLVLFVLGDDRTLSNLKTLVKDLDLKDNVIFHEKVQYCDVPKYIAMCDIGIVPLPHSNNWKNQSPLKLLEYLSMKKTVILTNIPANREILGNSKCGIYISSSDPEEIEKAIIFAYEHKEKLNTWGSSGRIIIEEKYTWRKLAKNFAGYLKSLE